MISTSRFQEAIARAADDVFYAHVPVDWWDAAAETWRPSIIESRVAGSRDCVSIIVPGPAYAGVTEVNYVMRDVALDEVRPSRLVDEAVAQFYSTRHTLELIDSLMPCIEMASTDERNQLDVIVNDLLDIYVASYEVWVERFVGGSGHGTPPTEESWADVAVPFMDLPRNGLTVEGRRDIFMAIDAEQSNGAIDCSPVAMWDESARIWRPTMLLGATGTAEQFSAASLNSVLVPGAPVDDIRVRGDLLQPLDMRDTCFSLIALPVLARDMLRFYDALTSAGFALADIAAHPMVIGISRLMSGAADEWTELFEEGLEGPEPERNVVPLAPELWGLTSGDNEVTSDGRLYN